MKYLACIALVCAFGQLALAAPSDVDCSKLDEIIDDKGSAQAITSFNEKYPLSSNLAEYMAKCKEIDTNIRTLKEYNSKCHTSLTKQVFSAILKTRTEMQGKRCVADAPETKEASDAVKCLKENALEKTKEAERKTILSSQILLDMNVADDKLRLKRACCGVIESRSYFMDATKEKCSQHEKIYAEYVDSYMAEAMGLICPDAKDLECGKLEPLKMEGVEPKTKFFLTPMLKVVKSLDHN